MAGISSKAAKCTGKMSVVNDEWVTGVWMGLKAFRQQDNGTEVHRPAPKFAEQFAFHFDMLDVFGIFGRLDGWYGAFVFAALFLAVRVRFGTHLLPSTIRIRLTAAIRTAAHMGSWGGKLGTVQPSALWAIDAVCYDVIPAPGTDWRWFLGQEGPQVLQKLRRR